jgi:hypothetical protein
MLPMESRQDFLLRRAREEDEAASRATCDKARELHEEMAARYRRAADANDEQRGPDGELKTILPDDFRIIG